MSGNNIKCKGAISLMNSLMECCCSKLSLLMLENNSICEEGGLAIANAISTGKFQLFMILCLNENMIRTAAVQLAKSLKQGKCTLMTKLNIENN